MCHIAPRAERPRTAAVLACHCDGGDDRRAGIRHRPIGERAHVADHAEGATLATQRADSMGGLVFRNVPPGSGDRVRSYPSGAESGPITVHSDAAAPWDPSIYNQSIPDNGYTYLTTRDGTQLAIDVHPPTDPAGEPGLPLGLPVPPGASSLPLGLQLPPLFEYSGYGYADPSGPVRDRGAREPDSHGRSSDRRKPSRPDRTAGSRTRTNRSRTEIRPARPTRSSTVRRPT